MNTQMIVKEYRLHIFFIGNENYGKKPAMY